MKANTYSLLNSQWMISEAGANSLKPYLFSILKGKEITPVASSIPFVIMHHDPESDEFTDVPDVASNSQYISVLSIKTPLYKYDQTCGPIGTRSMTRILKEWESNDNIIGVVLDIDSPGGQVSGLAEFADFLANYSKPIVSYTDGLMASAAYYVAAATDHIVSNKNADSIGSIGTMLSYVNIDGIYENMGAVIKDIYATKSTRKNEESRAMKEGSDNLIIKNILDPARDKFVADVKQYRNNIDESVFEGAIYNPSESVSLNLVDQLGSIQKAFDKVVELSKSNQSSNSNSNINMTTKSLPKVEAVLGLEASLALTENGSYLNEEQLDTIEASLNTASETSANLQTQLDDATANHQTAIDAVTEQLTDAQNNATTLETSVDAIMTNLGLSVEGALTEKLASLNSKSVVLGKRDGAGSTTPKIGATEETTTGKNSDLDIAGVSVSEALNC